MTAYAHFALTLLEAYLGSATLKAVLVTGTYAQSDEHQYYADLPPGAELTDPAYPAGGIDLPNVAITYDAVERIVRVTCDPLDFGTLTAPDIAGLVLYSDTGDPATSALLDFDAYDQPIDATGGLPFVHTPPPDGILTLAAPQEN